MTMTFSFKLTCNAPKKNPNRFQHDKGDYDSLRTEFAKIESESKLDGKNANEQ